MPAALFIVRATVADSSKRAAFDKWYENEHLPDAVKSFGVRKAWRFWSATDPAVHQAMYQFDDEASLDLATTGEQMKRLIADFNRDWPDVTRTRETLVLAQEFAA
jgi:hypothetical protein